jgi:hypothetical protein
MFSVPQPRPLFIESFQKEMNTKNGGCNISTTLRLSLFSVTAQNVNFGLTNLTTLQKTDQNV